EIPSSSPGSPLPAEEFHQPVRILSSGRSGQTDESRDPALPARLKLSSPCARGRSLARYEGPIHLRMDAGRSRVAPGGRVLFLGGPVARIAICSAAADGPPDRRGRPGPRRAGNAPPAGDAGAHARGGRAGGDAPITAGRPPAAETGADGADRRPLP